MDDLPIRNPQKIKHSGLTTILSVIGLIILLGMGAYFRFVGLDWDEDYHLHPDERFLTMVTGAIYSPGWEAIQSMMADGEPEPSPGSLYRLVSLLTHWKGYFNTAESGLNPNNHDFGFYVYGTFPLFIVRVASEWLDQTGYGENYLVGRTLSAIFDLGTVILVFLIAQKLMKKTWLALLAASFAAFSVLSIQHAHFYVVDTFANFFIYLAVYFAILVMTHPVEESTRTLRDENPDPVQMDAGSTEGFPSEAEESSGEEEANAGVRISLRHLLSQNWRHGMLYVLFGIASGMALASKISAAPVVLLLPAAAWIWYAGLAKEEKERQSYFILRNLLVAGVAALVVFRVLQPYAFQGPGFFNISLNDNWISTLKTLSDQSGGDVEFPPALQWARRPLSFAWTNMVRFGLGYPLGLFAWLSFAWLGWRLLKGEWRRFSLVWGWTAVFFTWQAVSFVRSMRYQLPVYPALALIAAWGIFALWEGKFTAVKSLAWLGRGKIKTHKLLALAAGVGLLAASAAWSFAFTRIYTVPVTRVAATEWVYQNIPAAFNLKIDTDEGEYNLPVAFQLGTRITQSQPLVMAFTPQVTGLVTQVQVTHIADRANRTDAFKVLFASISEDPAGNIPLTTDALNDSFLAGGDDERGKSYDLVFMEPAYLEAGTIYYLRLFTSTDDAPLDIYGQIILKISSYDGIRVQPLHQPVQVLMPGEIFLTSFRSVEGGTLSSVYLPRIIDWQAAPGTKKLRLEISAEDTATATLEGDFDPFSGQAESGYWLELDHPVEIQANYAYLLKITFEEGDGAIAVYGSQIARESTWDDVVPMGMDGFNAWDYTSGLYQSDLNFEMYWEDNPSKVDRFQSILDQADTIIITSNRQYGTTVRVPERYPLTTAYYRNLLGCPPDQSIISCYNVAEPGMVDGALGYQLVEVFQSEPRLGGWVFNTQFAEEAFTVYDHPKVLIFKKQADYDPEAVRRILTSVDLSHVVHVTPGKVTSYPANIELPIEREVVQTAGGTWSQYFNQAFIQNRYPVLALVLWYLATSLLGWVVYPFVRLALRGLSDRGFAFSRMAGLLLLAYPVWIAGSYGIPFTRPTIFAVFLLLVLINGGLFWWQKVAILTELRSQKKQIIIVEALTLFFFVLFLLIRLGNPDLWHQYKGGEKPMDFSYFNAVLKSTTFPPYDPWFAGGYINYYYYGFLLAGVPVKALGITPSVAYNLILPTFFSMFAMGAFSIGWNLLEPRKETRSEDEQPQGDDSLPAELEEPVVAVESPPLTRKQISSDFLLHWLIILKSKPFLAGIASSFLALILGNLGTVRMIWHGLIRLVVSGEQMEQAGSFQLWLWSFQGVGKFLSGIPLPYGLGDWYWIPSRAIPGEPITEFPFFTFLYADPHAHLFALPITLLVLGWCLAWIKQRCSWEGAGKAEIWLGVIAAILLASLAIGSLRPVNTWDMPTYLALSMFVMAYTLVRWLELPETFLPRLKGWMKKWAAAAVGVAVLVFMSFLLYQPFAHWYAPAYQSIELWKGGHTPFWSYITHWGLFFFFILSWFIWETIDWMAKTPFSSLKKLAPYRGLIAFLSAILLLGIAFLVYREVAIAWFAIPLAVWAGILILRPNQPDLKRLVLFCIGTALALTLTVELIVLKGDIGRMNTVFKFYLQAWSLFSISAAAGFFWVMESILKKHPLRGLPAWQNVWLAAVMVLTASAAMFPIMAGNAKIRDRMAPDAPHALDGMTYMQYSTYFDQETELVGLQDYQAIRWMQDNIIGSPVIVEGNTPEYRWGSRMTIYTGLPGVVGWNWHQRQQRALIPNNWITDRIGEIQQFYTTTDHYLAEAFLRKYQVKYIVVGQLEKAYYPGMGLDKFQDWNGDMWVEVFRYEDTAVYQVMLE